MSEEAQIAGRPVPGPASASETAPSGARPVDRAHRLESIQVLRGMAALAVVLYHAHVANIGYAGVDVFFVISGFVMGAIGARESPPQFISRRLLRIVPLYWLVTLAMCAVSLVPGAFREFEFTPATLAKSLLFIPYLDPTGHVWPLVVPGWTLNYEMFFYGVFAVALCTGHAARNALIVLAALIVAGLVFRPSDPIAFTYTNPLLIEFGVGLALSQFVRQRNAGLGLALILLGIGLFAIASYYNAAGDMSLERVGWFGIPAAALVAGALMVERAGRWPRLTWLAALGDASYSLYLLHSIVLSFAAKFVPLPEPINEIVAVAASVALAFASYRLFERPIMRLARKPGFARRAGAGERATF